jgi:hypothetical protein
MVNVGAAEVEEEEGEVDLVVDFLIVALLLQNHLQIP